MWSLIKNLTDNQAPQFHNLYQHIPQPVKIITCSTFKIITILIFWLCYTADLTTDLATAAQTWQRSDSSLLRVQWYEVLHPKPFAEQKRALSPSTSREGLQSSSDLYTDIAGENCIELSSQQIKKHWFYFHQLLYSLHPHNRQALGTAFSSCSALPSALARQMHLSNEWDCLLKFACFILNRPHFFHQNDKCNLKSLDQEQLLIP